MLAGKDPKQVFRSSVGKDVLWDTYLGSFPEGTNPIFKERTEHDCNCCKGFIRNIGNMVTVDEDGSLNSIWDITVDDDYQIVADELSEFVKKHAISNQYLHEESQVGAEHNHQMLEDGGIKTWNHLHFKLPNALVNKVTRDSVLGKSRGNKEILLSSYNSISLESINTVEDLIAQNSLYRGEEHLGAIKAFKKFALQFYKLNDQGVTPSKIDNLLWVSSVSLGELCRFKNTVIGTLLVDLTEGTDLEDAVKKFESKVAPSNYKRPTTLITKKMIDSAEKKIVELGLQDSLERRYATLDDITINNVIYADKSVKEAKGLFDSLKEDVKDTLPKLNEIKEVTIKEFIENIIPKVNQVELMFDGKHQNNLVSLIAPTNAEAKGLFKWGNNFSWSYNGEMADSIKERVKNAGGSVEGFMRASLSWFNYDDLDLSIREPDGNVIYYANKNSYTTGGKLDVDMNAGFGSKTRNAVENIIYKDKAKIKNGIYEVIVHNFCKRESQDVGFELEFEFDGKVSLFSYDQDLPSGRRVSVIKFEYKDGDIKIISSLPSTSISKEVWGVDTNKLHKVSSIMFSPNHWDGEETGNRHVFFMLEGCNNPDQARGFYNEFLNNNLTEHRKVFEVLASKMKVSYSDNQLSGLGFSTTKGDEVLCKVSGSFTRYLKIKF